jgi:hypothetical protein
MTERKKPNPKAEVSRQLPTTSDIMRHCDKAWSRHLAGTVGFGAFGLETVMADIAKRLQDRLDRPAIGFGYAVRNDMHEAIREIERLRATLRELDALITEDPQQISQAGQMRELIADALAVTP